MQHSTLLFFYNITGTAVPFAAELFVWSGVQGLVSCLAYPWRPTRVRWSYAVGGKHHFWMSEALPAGSTGFVGELVGQLLRSLSSWSPVSRHSSGSGTAACKAVTRDVGAACGAKLVVR